MKKGRGISVLGYEKYAISVSKNCFEARHVDFLLIGQEDERYYVLIRYFKTFMYNHTLNGGRKHFCCHWLPDFSLKKLLECHIKD